LRSTLTRTKKTLRIQKNRYHTAHNHQNRGVVNMCP